MKTFVRPDDLQGKKNIEATLSMYDNLINKRDTVPTIQKYFRADYIQHNPIVKDGPEGLIEFFSALAVQFPETHIVVHDIIAVEDQVWTHYNFIRTNDKNDLGLAGAEIFRFDGDGQFVEGWGTLQNLEDPAKALNSNGMF